MHTKTIIVDFDDFYQDNNRLDLLFKIKESTPEFKATVFTVVGRCSRDFLETVYTIDWLDMVPHGWMHETSRECQDWTYEQSAEYLDKMISMGFTRGFKAPGWQISDGMYKALLEKGFWVADQHYNDERRTKGLKVAYPGPNHYHIQNVCGNGLAERFSEIIKLKGNFQFIKDTL